MKPAASARDMAIISTALAILPSYVVDSQSRWRKLWYFLNRDEHGAAPSMKEIQRLIDETSEGGGIYKATVRWLLP